MSQLAREFPEEYARIAALPPSQQNAAERALADRLTRMPTTRSAETSREPSITKHCRDCGTQFEVPVEHAHSGSKWYSLCGSCIQYEL